MFNKKNIFVNVTWNRHVDKKSFWQNLFTNIVIEKRQQQKIKNLTICYFLLCSYVHFRKCVCTLHDINSCSFVAFDFINAIHSFVIIIAIIKRMMICRQCFILSLTCVQIFRFDAFEILINICFDFIIQRLMKRKQED